MLSFISPNGLYDTIPSLARPSLDCLLESVSGRMGYNFDIKPNSLMSKRFRAPSGNPNKGVLCLVEALPLRKNDPNSLLPLSDENDRVLDDKSGQLGIFPLDTDLYL